MTRSKPTPRITAALAILSLCTLFTTGCYERVVSSRGFGADSTPLSRPASERSSSDSTPRRSSGALDWPTGATRTTR